MTSADGQHRATLTNLPCPWTLIETLIGVVLLLAWFAHGDGTLGIDARATELIQNLDGPTYSRMADIGNMLGESRYAVVLVAVLMILTAITRRWPDLVFLASLLLLRGVATTFKALFDSPRPDATAAELTQHFTGYGFPSGHAITSSVTVSGLVVLALRRRDTPLLRVACAIIWLLCVSLTAFARIWVGAHWLTDTIAGVLVGAVIALTSVNIGAMVESRRPRANRAIA